MTIATSTEQFAACDAIATWARGVATPERVRAEINKPTDSWTDLFGQLAEFGLFAAILPEENGGFGATFLDVAAMIEQCGASLVPGPIGATVAAAFGLSHSDDPRASGLISGVATGEVPVAATAGAMTRQAVHIVDGHLDLGLVPGYLDDGLILFPASSAAGASWAVLPAGAGTRDVASLGVLDGLASVARVRISDISDDDLVVLGNPDAITGILHAALAAFQSGIARWTLDTAVEYAQVRTQFGVPIGSFQAIKHICAQMLCRSEQVTAVAWDLARAVDDLLAAQTSPSAPTGQASQADARTQLDLSRWAADVVVADAPVANAKDCIQVLGGIGFTFEHPAHLYLRAALAAKIALGQGYSQSVALGATGLDGLRRQFEIDLSEVEDQRAQIRADVAEIGALPADDRRRRLAESGYLTPHWPAPHGLGAAPALQLLIDAEFERAEVIRPDLVIAGWAIPTILEHGTEQQRDRFVAPTLAGEIVWCQLFSEPEAGSDLASLRTRAERVDGGWRLTGQKIWTSQAHNAQWGICLARTNPEAPKHKGITYFLVDMSSPGIDIRPLRELTGRANFNEVFLDGVVVPDECVVGDVDGGWRLARTTLANERVAMGGSGLGKEMEALLDQIADLPRALTEPEMARLGGLVAQAHTGRALDARSVSQRLAGHDPGAVSSVRKLIGVDHRQAVPEFALELTGLDGIAATDASEAVLQNRCLSIAGGTTQILRTAAAERILGLPRG